jgi:hypothetical protein
LPLPDLCAAPVVEQPSIVFQLAMQKLTMLPPELKMLPPGQSITEYRSLMYTHWLCGVSNRQFGSPGSVLPLKGRCEILDATYQESNILELSKPNPLHISEVTNEVTPPAFATKRPKTET